MGSKNGKKCSTGLCKGRQQFTLEESQVADTKAEMFSYVEIAMETNMDNNEYTLEECDVDDNEEGMI